MKNIQILWNKYSYFNLTEKESLMNEMNFAKALLEFNSNDDERKADIAKREDKIMRSIKFRAWHKEEELMCDITVLTDEGAFLVGVKPNEGQYFPNIGMYVPPITTGRFCKNEEIDLMQFTGLLDKNGKEIYEGDIIEMKITYAEYEGQDEDEMKIWYERGKVEFSSGCFWINTNGHSINCHFLYNDSDREVIGNIYENPELLK